MDIDVIAVTPDCEKVIEEAARTCYRSQEKATSRGDGKFLRALVARGHLSVLEHASATFRISGVSRTATHQLVRHRLCSFSQRSQRYVAETPGEVVVPPSIAGNPAAGRIFGEAVSGALAAYQRLIALGIPKEDARFVMPGGAASEIVVTANFRELRHVIQTRGSKHAQWEIRRIAVGMLGLIKQHAPNVFFDLFTCEDDYVEVRTEGQPSHSGSLNAP